MPRANPAPPVLPKELRTEPVERFDGLELEGHHLETCAGSAVQGERIRFDGVHVVGGTLGGSRFTELTWLDVLVERCDLSMVDWPGAKLTRVELRDCALKGASLSESELGDVRFVDCQLDYAVFARARFRRTVFERCRFVETDFSEAELAGAAFVRCTLQGVDFTRAKLKGADVSSSTLSEVRIGPGDVRGLVVNREQAAVLSQLFGIVLRDG